MTLAITLERMISYLVGVVFGLFHFRISLYMLLSAMVVNFSNQILIKPFLSHMLFETLFLLIYFATSPNFHPVLCSLGAYILRISSYCEIGVFSHLLLFNIALWNGILSWFIVPQVSLWLFYSLWFELDFCMVTAFSEVFGCFGYRIIMVTFLFITYCDLVSSYIGLLLISLYFVKASYP